MAKAKFNPLIKHLRGKIGSIVFRLCHTGEVVASKRPDMSSVKWSPAQKEHRQHFKVAVAYAKAAMANPELRAFFQQMAVEKKKRPFDMAVSHYYHHRTDLTSQQ